MLFDVADRSQVRWKSRAAAGPTNKVMVRLRAQGNPKATRDNPEFQKYFFACVHS